MVPFPAIEKWLRHNSYDTTHCRQTVIVSSACSGRVEDHIANALALQVSSLIQPKKSDQALH